MNSSVGWYTIVLVYENVATLIGLVAGAYLGWRRIRSVWAVIGGALICLALSASVAAVLGPARIAKSDFDPTAFRHSWCSAWQAFSQERVTVCQASVFVQVSHALFDPRGNPLNSGLCETAVRKPDQYPKISTVHCTAFKLPWWCADWWSGRRSVASDPQNRTSQVMSGEREIHDLPGRCLKYLTQLTGDKGGLRP
jgi:acyl-CoA thioesterase